MRRLVCLALVALAAAPAAGAATPWQRVSGPSFAGPQLGLSRDKFGTLSVAWSEGSPATITVTRLDKTGTAIGSSIVTSGFDGLGGLALLGFADGSLRLFAAGGRTRGAVPDGINSYTSPPGGTTWSFDPSGPFGRAGAYAAAELGATVAGNGWIVTSWSGAVVHIGVSPDDGDPSYQEGCCGTDPHLVTDWKTGSVVVAWISNSSLIEGTVVREILPTPEAQFALPSGTSDGSFGLAARIGVPGEYVAYVDPHAQKVQLYEYQGGLQTIATGLFQVANVFAAPEGRLWLVWGSSDGGIDVTRSNSRVTHFEPVQHVALPAGTNGLYKVQGEGSGGPLDLFADLLIGSNDRGFWRTHVTPQLAVTAKASVDTVVESHGGDNPKKTAHLGRVKFTVTDAGDPIAGAHITYGPPGDAAHLTTKENGTVQGPLALDKSGHVPAGLKLKVKVGATGYPDTTITVVATSTGG